MTGNKSEAIVVRYHSQERAELIFKSRLNPQLPTQVPLTRTTPHPTLLRQMPYKGLKCPKARRLWNKMGKAGGKREPSSMGGPEGGSEGSVPPLHSVPIWLEAALTSQEDVPRGRDWRGQLAH